MNIALLKRLRTRFLRMKHRRHFSMKDVAIKTDCGAAMCIAGHTLELAGYKRRYNEWADQGDYDWFTPNGRKVKKDLLDVAQKELGLTYLQAQHIEDGVLENKKNGLFLRFDLKTPKQAAKAIENLLKSAAET